MTPACLFLLAAIAQPIGFNPPALGDPAAWSAQPSWLANPAADSAIEKSPEGLVARAKGKKRGMKFSATLSPPVDPDQFPWLVVRYRCVSYDPKVDYLVWLGDEGRRGGLYLITPTYFTADGRWHTVAVDLLALGCSEIRSIAIQVKSAADEGRVTFAALKFTASPPEHADVFIPARGEKRRLANPGPGSPKDWKAQPSWLANPSAQAAVEKTDAGVRFVVIGAARGMKFSRNLPQPIPGGYVKMCYRAVGIRPSSDYALYMASAPGGKAPDEQYVIRLGDIIPDGHWHTTVAFCHVKRIKTLAVQVQALAERAELEISSLEIWGARPPVKLSEECPATAGWPDEKQMSHMGYHPLPPPKGMSREAAEKLMRLVGWWPAKKITVSGVPFLVGRTALVSGRAELTDMTYRLSGRWHQLYLLLGASLPATEAPGYNPARPRMVTYPHRFICELHYADGHVEQQMPVRLGTGRAEVCHGVGVYALRPDPSRRLTELVFRDGHTRGAFVLYAVTAGAKPGPADAVVKPRPVPPLKPRPRASDGQRLQRTGQDLTADSGALHMRLRLQRGVDLISLTSDYLPNVPTLAWQGSIFSVRLGDAEVRSGEAKVTAVHVAANARSATIALDLRPMIAMTATLTVAARQLDELSLALELQPVTQLSATPEVRFPWLQGCRTGTLDDTWVFYPRRGAVISNKAMAWSSPHSGLFPLQVMGIFRPRGGGLYVRTEYTAPLDEVYDLTKDPNGVHMAVRYPWWRGEKLACVIGTNPDDFHGELAAYNRWRKTWFRPAAPRKGWFRRVFNFRQQFLTFPVPRRSGLFDPKTKTFHFAEVLARDRKAFGGIDYLHLFDWGWSPSHGRCGDYQPWDYLGPPQNFRREILRLQQAGLPVGLYIEGRLVSPKSSMYKTAQPWQIIDAHGHPIHPYAPDYSICPWVKGWQDHLQAVYRRVSQQTGALGYYIDEFGFAGLACWGHGHGHRVPRYIAGGELQLTRKVRAAIGPDRVLYTEESPPDITMQYQDGSFTYAISSVSDAFSPDHVNITRFAVPDFKTIEIICCDKPLGENIEALRRILFNGEAIWLEGMPGDWFDPRSLQFIRHMHSIMKTSADCFTSLNPQPLVPTRWQGLYANRFPSDDGRRCIWTVYWTGPATLTGPWLDVPRAPGARYRELWAGRKLTVRHRGRLDTIGGTINPHEVLVLLQESTG